MIISLARCFSCCHGLNFELASNTRARTLSLSLARSMGTGECVHSAHNIQRLIIFKLAEKQERYTIKMAIQWMRRDWKSKGANKNRGKKIDEEENCECNKFAFYRLYIFSSACFLVAAVSVAQPKRTESNAYGKILWPDGEISFKLNTSFDHTHITLGTHFLFTKWTEEKHFVYFLIPVLFAFHHGIHSWLQRFFLHWSIENIYFWSISHCILIGTVNLRFERGLRSQQQSKMQIPCIEIFAKNKAEMQTNSKLRPNSSLIVTLELIIDALSRMRWAI